MLSARASARGRCRMPRALSFGATFRRARGLCQAKHHPNIACQRRAIRTACCCIVLHDARQDSADRPPKSPLISKGAMVLPVWIEHTTSPLPRECSTTELRQRAASGANSGDPPTANGAAVSAALGSKPLARCAQHLARDPTIRRAEISCCRMLQTTICVPISTTRSEGIWK